MRTFNDVEVAFINDMIKGLVECDYETLKEMADTCNLQVHELARSLLKQAINGYVERVTEQKREAVYWLLDKEMMSKLNSSGGEIQDDN